MEFSKCLNCLKFSPIMNIFILIRSNHINKFNKKFKECPRSIK